jgi:hypothetical protein
MAVKGGDGHVQQVTVVIDGGPGTDDREVAELTSQLRRRLLELEVESVELERGGAIPEGAKPLDPTSIGALVVTLTTAVLPAALALVDTWLQHRPVRGVKVTIDGDSIEMTDASEAAQQRLLKAFVERHVGS